MIHFFDKANNLIVMKIIPYGGVEGVTGSCFFVETEQSCFLIDCGFYQGEENSRNNRAFPFNIQNLDAVFLTHAHLDHSGRLPLLVKSGFKGRIICTEVTANLTKIMLLDAAKVMEEDYHAQMKKALRRGEKAKEPLYTEEDVIRTTDYFYSVPYHTPIKLNDNVTVTLKDAGHILGSAFIEISVIESGHTKKIIFSGDLGNRNKPIVNDPEKPSDADVLFIETTYGDREHKNFDETYKEFENAIYYAFSRGGNIIIPSFALERAQELLYILREMYIKKTLQPCRVFLDSPLAILATNLYKKHLEYFDEEAQKIIKSGGDPFYFPYLIFSKSTEDSKAINNIKGRAIIIAGSGMCNGGRILHHLKHNLWDDKNCVIFIGFQAKGTLGRQIVDGEKTVYIYGEPIKVAAKICTINGFSSHADKKILLNWISSINSLSKVYLIHGENGVKQAFKKELEKMTAVPVNTVKEMQEIYI